MLFRSIYYETWSNLGFGKPLALIPSIETPGVLKLPYEWSNADKRTASFGYGPMNTNLAQLARAYLVFGNEGSIPRLKLFQNFNKFDEDNVKVFKRETVSNIANHLKAVVENGSGYRAKMGGHEVAGKTGTSKKLIDGQYSEKEFISSFVGFFPVENPQLLCLIILDSPDASRNLHWGSMSSAPVFKSVMDRVINIDKSISISRSKKEKLKNEPILIQKNLERKIEYVEMPNLIGKTVRDAFSELKRAGIKPQISGRGLIVSQSIEAGTKIEKKSICILKAELKE